MAGLFLREVTAVVDELIVKPTMIVGDVLINGLLNQATSEESSNESEESSNESREASEERQNREAAEANRIRRELSAERRKLAAMERHMAEMERERRQYAIEQERQREKNLARLAQQVFRVQMPGNNIGVFGLTSTGKSTVINGLIGQQVAAVGVGETTAQKQAYQGMHCTYWDTPGRNDESTYTNKEYISFIKGLTRRLIVIQYTIKENLKLMQLLDSLGLGYDIIVNKFDDVDEDEQWTFRRQIEREAIWFGLQRVKHTYFLSAKHPKMFPDWLRMVTHLTEPCSDYDQKYIYRSI